MSNLGQQDFFLSGFRFGCRFLFLVVYLVHGAVDDLHHPEYHKGDEQEVDDGADEGADGEDADGHLVKGGLAADEGDDGLDDSVYNAIDDSGKRAADDHAHS